MIIKEKVNPIVTELLIRSRKINIFLVFITQSYFAVSKNVKLNSTNYSTENSEQAAASTINHSSDIGFKNFMKIYKKCAVEPYSFLGHDTTLPADNPLRFQHNLLESKKIKYEN